MATIVLNFKVLLPGYFKAVPVQDQITAGKGVVLMT